jgi:hypothetical protein
LRNKAMAHTARRVGRRASVLGWHDARFLPRRKQSAQFPRGAGASLDNG